MSDINTESMSREELEATAKDLGIRIAHNAKDETVREKIGEALGETTGATPESAVASQPDDNGMQKRFEIIIATHDQDKQPVPIGVNGKTWLVQRGKKVIVPESVVEVLRNAIQFQYDPKTMERSEIQSYPFQIVREVA